MTRQGRKAIIVTTVYTLCEKILCEKKPTYKICGRLVSYFQCGRERRHCEMNPWTCCCSSKWTNRSRFSFRSARLNRFLFLYNIQNFENSEKPAIRIIISENTSKPWPQLSVPVKPGVTLRWEAKSCERYQNGCRSDQFLSKEIRIRKFLPRRSQVLIVYSLCLLPWLFPVSPAAALRSWKVSWKYLFFCGGQYGGNDTINEE